MENGSGTKSTHAAAAAAAFTQRERELGKVRIFLQDR